MDSSHLARLEWIRTVVALLVLSIVAWLGVQGYQTNQATKCQVRFNSATSDVIADRSSATDEWMTNQLAYLDIVAEQDKTPAQRLAALNEYRASLRSALLARRSAPLPEDPQCRH